MQALKGFELARFRLKPGVGEDRIATAYARMEERHLAKQAGYGSHRLIALDDGVYLDLTFATTRADAERICASWTGQPDCEAFLALIVAESIQFGSTLRSSRLAG